jgi:hypothetical protein
LLKENRANSFVNFILKPDHFWQQQETPAKKALKANKINSDRATKGSSSF